MGKIVTLRSAVIMGTAVAAGSVAGTVAEALGHLAGGRRPGWGRSSRAPSPSGSPRSWTG